MLHDALCMIVYRLFSCILSSLFNYISLSHVFNGSPAVSQRTLVNRLNFWIYTSAASYKLLSYREIEEWRFDWIFWSVIDRHSSELIFFTVRNFIIELIMNIKLYEIDGCVKSWKLMVSAYNLLIYTNLVDLWTYFCKAIRHLVYFKACH